MAFDRMIWRLALLVIIASMTVTDLSAQPRMPSARRDAEAVAIPQDADTLSKADLARKLLDDFGRCLLNLHPYVARDIIATPRPSERTTRQVGAASDCIRPERNSTLSLRFQGDLLRGSVFKAYYGRDHHKAAPVFAAAPGWALDFLGTSGISPADQSVHVALRTVAACLVDAEPQAVHALVLASAGSATENEAFRQIQPRIAECVPEGVTVELSRGVLTGILAEVAQRRALRG